MKRKAGEPAAIHVEQDDKTWDITPEELDQLPKELQPHVKAMLGQNYAQRYTPEYPIPLTRWIQSNLIGEGERVRQGEKIIELPKFPPRKSSDNEEGGS